MTKFKFIVRDSINQEELSKVFGGDSTGLTSTGSACNLRACSHNVTKVVNFCSYGDGVCKSQLA
jgi:hypothetical protein